MLPGIASAQQLDNLDPSFGSGGEVTSGVASGAAAVVLQPDGKLVVGGSVFDSQGAQEAVVARFDPDGTPDATFGDGGKLVFQAGAGAAPSSAVNALALQPNGKVVAAGSASDANGNPAVMVARLDPSGALDTSFGSGGEVVRQLGAAKTSTFSFANAVLLQSDGKIVVGGHGDDGSGNSRFLIARLSGATGALDATFGVAGKVFTQIGSAHGEFAEEVDSLALQPGGEIVAGGHAADASGHLQFTIVRLGPLGTISSKLVKQFGVGSHPSSSVLALAIEPDGTILAGGNASTADANPEALLARVDANGAALDPSFGAGGVALNQFGSGDECQCETGRFSSIDSLALQPDGKVLAAGLATLDGGDATLVGRFGGDGGLDTSFAAGGTLIGQLGTGALPTSQLTGLATLPDGRIVAGGVANDDAGNTNVLLLRLIHDAPPTALFSIVTSPAVAGQPVAFDARASSDADGSVASFRWDFGDNSSGSGPTPTHVYATPGDYRVALTVSDDKGITTTVSKTVTVAPGTVFKPLTVASISSFGLNPRAFRAAGRGSALARDTGTDISYRDSAAALTRFTVFRAERGVKQGRTCRKADHGRTGRACTRFVRVGHFSHQDVPGLNRIHFSGRVHGRKLRPGRYRLQAIPRIHGRGGRPVVMSFRVVR